MNPIKKSKTMKNIMTFFLCSLCLFFKVKAQNSGDSLFSPNHVYEINLNFTQPNYWDSLVNNYAMDQYMSASFYIDGISLSSVGVKFKGNSSYNNPSIKKSFKIDFNQYVLGQEIDGLKKINLNNVFKDPSFLRERLVSDFYQEHGLLAPRCVFAKVFLNGTYWGLYNLVEEVDTKQFLNTHFGYHDGNMFKGDPTGDLRFINSTISSYYPKYELHTNETINDWSDLYEFINKINNSGVNFHDSLESILNTQSFIAHWAALNMFENLDSYIGSGHNYFIYDDSNTGKFEWVAWDVNEAFGNFRMGMTESQLRSLSLFYVPSPGVSRPLIFNMGSNNSYHQLLADQVCEWLQYDFSNLAFDHKIDSLADVIRPFVYADNNKFYSNQLFETNLSSDVMLVGPNGGSSFGLKSFIDERRTFLLTELSALGCFPSTINNVTNNSSVIYPNPSTGFLTIKISSNITPHQISIKNSLAETVLQKENVINETTLDLTSFSNGIYFMCIDEMKPSKIILNR